MGAPSRAARRLRLLPVLGSVAVVALLAGACAQLANIADPDATNDAAQDAGLPCSTLAVRSCALPFPSDQFTVTDPTSSTGRRLNVPEGLIPENVRDALGPGAGVSDAFDGADGFSALSPVIFELDRAVQPESLPGDGGDQFVVIDEATGERQAIRAEVWTEAALRGAPGTIVMAWPVTTWEYGHTYVARVAGLHGYVGDPVAPSALRHPDAATADILDTLEAGGAGNASVFQSVTRFSVGSHESVTSPMKAMAATARAEDHPVRALEARPPLFFENGAAIITGEVRLTDFRDSEGVVHPDAPQGEAWVPFVLAVPKRADGAAAPVAVYGHGLLINKESMFVVASQNAAHGVATIGIDVPNHGGREAGQGGYILDITTPQTLGRLVGLPLQGIIDHVSLVKAIIDHLGTVDLSPWNPFGASGDGVADLDTSLLLYEGTSMGGVLGVGEFALIPELDAAYFQVPGAGILDIISHSLLWTLFRSIIPSQASAGDSAALFGAASMLLDRADPTHLLGALRASDRPVVAQNGVGDGVLPQADTARLVKMLDLPRIGPALTDIPASSNLDELGPDGRGFQEIWPLNSSPFTQPLMAHLAFTEPAAQPLLNTWLAQRLALAGK